jgi:Na+-driven multidrug efflux pump
MMCAPKVFARMFTDDATLLNLSGQYLPVFVAGMLIFGVQRACQTTFVAVCRAKISLFIAILRKIILLVPLSFILPIFMGVGGVFCAEGIADATAATICGIIFFFYFRHILKSMPDESPQQ